MVDHWLICGLPGYYYPNDETEAEREDMKHHAFRLLLADDLHMTRFAVSPLKVLDVGTGTGRWDMHRERAPL